MKLYSDIGKVAKKLLNDDYVSANKLKVSSKTSSGVTYTVTGVHNAKQDAIDADLAAKFKLKDATVTTKLFTAAKTPTVELKYESSDGKGRKVNITTLGGKGLGNTSAEINAGALGIKLGADLIKSDMYASAAVAVSPENFKGFIVLGAEGTYSSGTKEVTSTNYAVSFFDGKESEASVHVLDQGRKGMVSYSHHVRQGFSVGAQMTYIKETKATMLNMGLAYRMDGATTIKAKMDSEGICGLSYIQEIRPKTTLIMSSKFSAKTLENPKLGISLAIE